MTQNRATAIQNVGKDVTSSTTNTHTGPSITVVIERLTVFGDIHGAEAPKEEAAPNSKWRGVAYGALILGGAVFVVAIGAQASALAGTAVAAKAGIGATLAMLKGLSAKSAATAALA